MALLLRNYRISLNNAPKFITTRTYFASLLQGPLMLISRSRETRMLVCFEWACFWFPVGPAVMVLLVQPALFTSE